MSKVKYDGWCIHDGNRFLAWSIRDTKEDTELAAKQYMSHSSKLISGYRIVKVRIVEVDE